MNEPWFNPALYSWIPGTLMGVFGGILGGLSGTLAPQGKARGLVLGSWLALLIASAALLITGIYAFFAGQPYGIWYGFGLAGLLGLLVGGPLYPVILIRYRQAEERRIAAEDARL